MKKLIWFIFLLALLTPLVNAQLAEGESSAAIGITFLVFLFGVLIVVVSMFVMYMFGDKLNIWVSIGLMCFGIVVVLYSLNMSVVIANQISSFTLSTKLDRVVGSVGVAIKIFSYGVLILFILMIVKLFLNKKQAKKSSDGWDNDSY